MLGSLIKAFGYSKARKKTFALLHPVRTARAMKLRKQIRRIGPRVATIGAATAVAIPLGIMWARRRAPGM